MADQTIKKPKEQWHSVSVIATREACAAAVALRGQRYLPGDAPKLPLKECTQQRQCVCAFKHHSDRRAGPRRSSETGGMPKQSPATDLRKKRGRRSADYDD